jgi:hypothetical protein
VSRDPLVNLVHRVPPDSLDFKDRLDLVASLDCRVELVQPATPDSLDWWDILDRVVLQEQLDHLVHLDHPGKVVRLDSQALLDQLDTPDHRVQQAILDPKDNRVSRGHPVPRVCRELLEHPVQLDRLVVLEVPAALVLLALRAQLVSPAHQAVWDCQGQLVRQGLQDFPDQLAGLDRKVLPEILEHPELVGLVVHVDQLEPLVRLVNRARLGQLVVQELLVAWGQLDRLALLAALVRLGIQGQSAARANKATRARLGLLALLVSRDQRGNPAVRDCRGLLVPLAIQVPSAVLVSRVLRAPLDCRVLQAPLVSLEVLANRVLSVHQVQQVSLDLLDLQGSRDHQDLLALWEEQDPVDSPVQLDSQEPLDKLVRPVMSVLPEQQVYLEGLAVRDKLDHLDQWDSQVHWAHRELRVLLVHRDLLVNQDLLDLPD